MKESHRKATGTYSDNSTANISNQVTWSSSNSSVATIAATGVAAAVAIGSTNVSASVANANSNVFALTVTVPTLTSITITAPSGSIAKGTSEQFTATGTYSDNSMANITNQVTWSSSNIGTATISATGLATAVAAGSTNISASLGGFTSNSFSLAVTQPASLAVVSFNVLFGSQSYNALGTTRNRLPWQITGIQVVFSQPVVNGNLNSLTGVTVTGFSGLGTNTLTWTISPLTLGSFTATLAGSGANALAGSGGNPLNSGAGFSQTLKVLPGDLNDDGVVSSTDLVGVNNAIPGPYNIFADINGDGVVNISDVQAVRNAVGTSLP
jgi:trimeric autotransporter adhesin